MHQWLKSNKIKVNLEKNLLFLCRKKLNLSLLRCGTGFFSQTNPTKIIRLVIDEMFKLKDHVITISYKFFKACYVFYGKNGLFPHQHLKFLCNSLNLPHLTYYIEAWLGATHFH